MSLPPEFAELKLQLNDGIVVPGRTSGNGEPGPSATPDELLRPSPPLGASPGGRVAWLSRNVDDDNDADNPLAGMERKVSVKLDRKSFPTLYALPDTDVQLQPGEQQEHLPAHEQEVQEEALPGEHVGIKVEGEAEPEGLGLGLSGGLGLEPVVPGDFDGGATPDGQREVAAAAAAAYKAAKSRSKKQKLTAPSTWLKIDNKGEASLIQVDKHKLTHKLGVQTRDLRILDPQLALSSPPAILDREKAIVVNLEHVKAVITLNYVLVVNPELPSSLPLVSELKAKLATGRMGKKALSYTGLSDAASGVRLITAAAGGFDLPFELKALEVCLDMIAVHLDEAAKTLEAEAYPTLDSLTHKVSAGNLERTRRIKNRLVRLKTRVETIREVLERFLNDDEDMHRLHLTGNEIQRQASLRAPDMMMMHGDDDELSSVSGASSDSSVDEAETAAVEMLLEAYFMYLDSTYNRLQTLNEYIGDTEDLVSIKLDQHRNQLIAIDLCLTSFSAVVGIMTTVGGYFGMNLYSGLSDSPHVFNIVCSVTSAGGVALFAAFVYWLWRMKLLTY